MHRLDAAALFRLALEKAPRGSVVHGVGETAVTLASIAHSIGEGLAVPTRSIDAAEASEHYGGDLMAAVFSTDSPASSTYTRRLVGWSPRHPTLLQDLRNGVYF